MKTTCITTSILLLALAGSACSSAAQNAPAAVAQATGDQMARAINESTGFQTGAIKGMEASIDRQLGADSLKCVSPAAQDAMRDHFSLVTTTSLDHSEILEGYEIASSLKGTDLDRYVYEHFESLYQRANQMSGNVSHTILRTAAKELHFNADQLKNVEKLLAWDERNRSKIGPQLQAMEPRLTNAISQIVAGCSAKSQ